jgi:peptide/bleomycin uptake transporter
MVYIFTAMLTQFITTYYAFRWRTAMNDFYVEHWHRLRHIGGASQRIQKDTQKFARLWRASGRAWFRR